MLSPYAIEQALKAELPTELHASLPPLAEALADHVDGSLSETELHARLDGPDMQRVLHALIGRQVPVGVGGDYIAFGDVSHSKGVAVGRGAIAIGDLTIVIQEAPATDAPLVPSTVRFAPIIVALVAIIALVAIVSIVALRMGAFEQSARSQPRPDPAQLRSVGPQDLTITALVAFENDLWVGAAANDRYALYHLDASQGANALPRKILDVDAEIIGLTVDCKKNVWISLSNVGTLVYRPVNGDHSTLLNSATTQGWLVKNTTQAIATRCANEEAVDVWLGRVGVRQVHYTGDYPTAATMTLLAPQPNDPVQGVADVRALLYITTTETLLVASSDGRLVSSSLRGILQPKTTNWHDPALWSLSMAPDGTIWVGGSQHLIHIGDPDDVVSIAQADGVALDSRAFVLAAGRTWVWFGDRVCQQTTAPCWPLGVQVQGALFPVDIGQRKEVHDIVVDQHDQTWIGTESGLIIYPSQAN